MPLVRFDIVEGRSAAQVKALLNAAHSALIAAFRIPGAIAIRSFTSIRRRTS